MRLQLAEQRRKSIQDIIIYILATLASSSVYVKPVLAKAEEELLHT